MQILKFKPKTNLGPLWDTITTIDKMPINKQKSKEQVVTFFININKHNQYSHFITCNINHWLITQKTIKQPQVKVKTQTANWFLTRILVPWTTRCLSRFYTCNTMSIADVTRIFACLGLVKKREWIFVVWSVLCSNLE